MAESLKNKIELRLKALGGRPLLLSVSGGIDSMVLAHVLKELQYPFQCAHFYFGLRQEAIQESVLVKKWCEENQIPLHMAFLPLANKTNVQNEARHMRRSKLFDWASTMDLKITMAHHLNDQLETFFLQAFRGSGPAGLKGMDSEDVMIFRPLLDIPKSELVAFAQEHSVPFLEDSSNAEDHYERNLIRNQIFPLLFEGTSGQRRMQGLKRSMNIQKETETFLKAQERALEDELVYGPFNLIQLPDHQRFSSLILTRWLLAQGFSLEDIKTCLSGKADRSALFIGNRNLLQSNLGGLVLGSTTFQIHDVIFRDISEIRAAANQSASTKYDLDCLGQTLDSLRTVQLQSKYITFPLTFRRIKVGDRIAKMGLNGQHTKVNKLLADQKCPRILKERLPVLVDGNGVVLWVPFFAVAESDCTSITYDDEVISLSVTQVVP